MSGGGTNGSEAEGIRPYGMDCPKKSPGLRQLGGGRCLGMVFAGVIEIKSVSVDRYRRRVTLVYSVMRYLNAERAGRDHLWRARKAWSGRVTARVYPTSPPPVSVNRGYHKTLEPVKGREACGRCPSR